MSSMRDLSSEKKRISALTESYLSESYALWERVAELFYMQVPYSCISNDNSAALLTSLLLFQRIMAEAHEDEDTVIEEEYKV